MRLFCTGSMALAISTSLQAAASGSPHAGSARSCAPICARRAADCGRCFTIWTIHEYERFLPIQRLALFECEDGSLPN
jgi:hypothetical protein